jgi:ankyrin repeat protein
MCRLLIAHGADVNAKDVRGQTPLFEVFDRWAIHLEKYLTASPDVTQAKALAVLQLLLENGADPTATATSTTATSTTSTSTTSTSHSGTVLDIFHNMPKAFRDALKKTDRE